MLKQQHQDSLGYPNLSPMLRDLGKTLDETDPHLCRMSGIFPGEFKSNLSCPVPRYQSQSPVKFFKAIYGRIVDKTVEILPFGDFVAFLSG